MILWYNDDISNKDITMTLTQFINYINYSTIRPDRVSVVRWDAMIKYAKVNGYIS